MAQIHRLPIIDTRQDSSPGEPVDDADLIQVGDLARLCGKTVRAIHHYENLGLLRPHKRSKGRFRLYAPDAVSRVRWIGKLNDLGMTLSEVQQILSTWEESPNAIDAMTQIRAVFQQRLDDVRSQIDRLSMLERELGRSVDYLDTCDTCEPTELIAACSACTVHDKSEPEPELVAGLYANR